MRYDAEVCYIEFMKSLKMVMLLLMALLLSLVPVDGATIKGGVVYTVESAREEAFRGMEYEISMEPYKGYMRDPGYRSMGEGKRPKVSKRGRSVTLFSDGSYSVRYYRDWVHIYYYSSNGVLEYIEFRKIEHYPAVTRTYGVNGRLSDVSYFVSGNEIYVYEGNKNFTYHWIGKNCYDANGKLVSKRK